MGNKMPELRKPDAPTAAGASPKDVITAAQLASHSIRKGDLPQGFLRLPEGWTPPEAVPVKLPSGFEDKYAVVLRNVLTPEEVQALVALTEAKGYDAARVSLAGGRQRLDNSYRKGSRCILDSLDLGRAIFERVRHAVPDVWRERGDGMQWDVCGCNERLRFLKYGKGDFFAVHMDGTYVRGRELGEERVGETSFVTLQLYLNGGMDGGATRFFGRWDHDDVCHVTPEPGMVLLFEHRILHDGQTVSRGLKYTMRTDIMYTNKGPGHEY